jgi:diguanylate cyclase (GGDEF)-like protein/hemerythrin-like metal-binding protein
MLDQLNVATIFGLIIVFCLAQAVSIGWVTLKNNLDGLGYISLSLCLHAIGYCLFLSSALLNDVISIVGGNVALSLSCSLYNIALYTFQGRRIRYAWQFFPSILMFFVFSYFTGDPAMQVGLGTVVFCLQVFALLFTVLRYDYDFKTGGRDLIVVGLALIALALVARVYSAFAMPDRVARPLEPSAVQFATYFSVFVGLLLISNGFVMMAKERLDHALRNAAQKDRLTGCWNRARVEEVGRQEIERLHRYGYPASLMIIDIDHFKEVNDRHGHAVGDTALTGFCRVARRSVRVTDLFGRWGGEEFVMILPSTALSEAMVIADRIRADLERTVFPGSLRVTASFGVSSCRSTERWEDWLDRADKALYRAKETGRNRVCTCDVNVLLVPSSRAAMWVSQLSWKDTYRCGIDEIDRQHEAIFTMANTLILLVQEDAAKSDLIAVARAGLDDINRHFVYEEELLRAIGFADAENHSASHRALLDRAEELLRDFTDDRSGAVQLMHFVVYEVIAEHLLVEDSAYFAETRQAAANLTTAGLEQPFPLAPFGID